MKLFYLTALDDMDREKCGILGKITGQINSFKKSGIDVYFGHFHGQNTFIIENEKMEKLFDAGTGNTRARLGEIYDKLFCFIKDNDISTVYIRFTSLDNKAITFYKKMKKRSIKVIIEFYSHNLELEAKKTVVRNFKNGQIVLATKGLVSLLINKYYFSKLRDCVDRIVTTTKIGDLYGVPTINVINGIDTSSVNVRSKETNEYDFNIVSVAMISPWHGYDRVIKGLYEYYKNGGEKNVLYTVIGDGEEKNNLEKLVDKLNLKKHVVFTGIKLNEELEYYYNLADIALEMLAGFRRTKGQISSIKMAEYFAKGIPVLYASDIKLYKGEMEKYCFWVNNSDDAVDIEQLIGFCDELYSKDDSVEDKMHAIAKKQFDWMTTMEELHSFIHQ